MWTPAHSVSGCPMFVNKSTLLVTCVEQSRATGNIFFRLSDRKKATWMFFCLRHWHPCACHETRSPCHACNKGDVRLCPLIGSVVDASDQHGCQIRARQRYLSCAPIKNVEHGGGV
uniref:Uncharacterized protein n=1 Tax=Schistocephalus solidus TaxID=70667 RepID=A0A0V0J606_SCHSO